MSGRADGNERERRAKVGSGAAGHSSYWRLEGKYTRVLRRLRRLRAELHRERAVRRVQAVGGSPLERDFLCIYAGENGGYGWSADTGNGYYGGLQMDDGFERTYGPEYYRAWGHSSNWPESVQIAVAIRAYLSGRGFEPWPNTSRACGLR